MDRFIRNSEIARFKDCRRSWMNGYHLNLTLPPSPDKPASGRRDVGTLCHAGLAAGYSGQSPSAAIDAAQAELEIVLDAQHIAAGLEPMGLSDDWLKDFELARIMVDGYFQWVATEGADVGRETIGVEVEFIVPFGVILGDMVYLVCHIDWITRDAWGNIIIDDHKTVDNLAKSAQFQVDDQLLNYALMYRLHTGETPAFVEHNMLRKVKRSVRATPPFYGRESFAISEPQFAAHWDQLAGTLHDLVLTAQRLEAEPERHQFFAYPSPDKDCGWKCDFLPICRSHDDGTDIDGLRHALYVQRTAQDGVPVASPILKGTV